MKMTEKFNLSGRTALVTGSSEGIGRAIVLALAEFGASVVVHDKSSLEKSRAVARTIEEDGGKVTCCIGDIGREEGLMEIMRQIDAVDILVLNASIQIKKPFENITRDEFELQMNANVWSAVRLINFYQPSMKSKGWGRILFLGSVQQVKPHPHMAIYAATKSSIENLMINLAAQFAPDHITVNSIAPGVILTGRNTEALSDKEYAEVVRKKIPMGDFGRSEDCAALALMLCTEAGRYITGQSIYCDGGMSL